MDYHAGFMELSKTLQEIASNLGRGSFHSDAVDERVDALRAAASIALKKQGWVYYDTEGWRYEQAGYIEGKLPTDLDLPPAYRTQANLWQARYFEARCELVSANKGLRRLRGRLDRVLKEIGFKEWFELHGGELLRGWLRARESGNEETLTGWVIVEWHLKREVYVEYSESGMEKLIEPGVWDRVRDVVRKIMQVEVGKMMQFEVGVSEEEMQLLRGIFGD